MSLKFVEVVKQHHKTQTYHAVAINDMGRTDYPMYITEGMKRDEELGHYVATWTSTIHGP